MDSGNTLNTLNKPKLRKPKTTLQAASVNNSSILRSNANSSDKGGNK